MHLDVLAIAWTFSLCLDVLFRAEINPTFPSSRLFMIFFESDSSLYVRVAIHNKKMRLLKQIKCMEPERGML